MTDLNLKTGSRVRRLVAAADVTILAVEPHGNGIVSLVGRGDDGQTSDRLLTAERAPGVSIASGRRRTFDADRVSLKHTATTIAPVVFNMFVPGQWWPSS